MRPGDPVEMLAEALFRAYFQEVLPGHSAEWNEIHEGTRAGWRAAARRSIEVYFEKDRKFREESANAKVT